MRRAALLGLAGLLALGTALAQPAKPVLETISYADLGKWVRSNKGKVVVVYFWAHY
jgi:hypothetical protein